MSGKFNTSVNAARCKACGYCREVCPAGVFEASGDKSGGYNYMVARNGDKCIGCHKCQVTCPDFAITVTPK